MKDKCIVITGGAGVLCGTMAKHLAQLGAKICIVDYDVFRANKLCKEIEAEGNSAIPVQANVSDKKEIKEAFDRNLNLDNLLLGNFFKEAIEKAQTAWRKVVITAIQMGIPIPAMGAALTFYDGYRSDNLCS